MSIRHALLYGPPGIGKTTMEATNTLPQLVLMCDPIGKHNPYINGLYVYDYSDKEERFRPIAVNVQGVGWKYPYILDCFSDPQGKDLVRRLVFISEPDTKKPFAYLLLDSWLASIGKQLERIGAKSFTLDSLTRVFEFSEYHHKVRGVPAGVPEGPWGFANMNRNLVLDIVATVNDYKLNTTIICHTSYDTIKSPDMPVYSVQAPGKTKESLLSMFGDYYHLSMVDGEPRAQVSMLPGVPYSCNNSYSLKGYYPNSWVAIEAATKVSYTMITPQRKETE